ncbi:MAG: acyltransferase [Pseudolysinimonas sp.]
MSSLQATHRTNNFDALRLIASVTVVITHSWPLTGRTHAPQWGGVLLSHVAVYVFFSISGYLIATSWNSSRSARGYFARRVARIFPAVIVVVLLTVFLIGPLVTTDSLSRYFANAQTWTYLQGLVLAPTYLLPGVFEHNPTSAVNGSLWSLGPEFICYLLVAVIGLATWRMTRARPNVRTAVFAMLAVALMAAYWFSPDRAIRDGAGAMVFFMVGAIVAERSLRLPLWPVVPIVLLWGTAGMISRDVGMVAAWIALPYATLSIGLRGTPGVERAGRFGDFSYGIYLWAFPVQQIIWWIAPGLPLAPDILVVLAVTGGLAIASWHLVERRSIALGRRISRALVSESESAPT